MDRRRLWALQSRYAAYLFVLPFLVLFCTFMLYPLGRSITLSLRKSAGPRLSEFIGVGHYSFILTDWLFWVACLNTLAFAVMFLSIQIPASLGLALLLNRAGLRGRTLLRFAFFSPHFVGVVFVAVLFRLLMAPRQGLINRIIDLVPGISGDINWLGDPLFARPAIVIAALWLNIGLGMVYFLAALQNVDPELREAAAVDGAGACSRFRHVTLPAIRPVMAFLVVVGTIGSLSLFELPYIFFQGPGPRLAGLTVVMYLYEQGFQLGDLGFAAAVGWVLVVLILLVTMTQLGLMRAAEGRQ